MPRNDKITINSFSVPEGFPGEEWKTFISILYHESADDVINNLVNAEIERIIKEDSAKSPNKPLSSHEVLDKTRLAFFDYLKMTDPDLFQAYTNDNTNLKENQQKGDLL